MEVSHSYGTQNPNGELAARLPSRIAKTFAAFAFLKMGGR